MLNPIICPVRGNVHLTRKAIATFEKQDIEGGTFIVVVNNASMDGTNQYLMTKRDIAHMYFAEPQSVAASWNRALEFVFKAGAEYALVVNNDVELLPETYRLLVADGGGFVTAVGRREWPETDGKMSQEKRPHPDFSCYLIRREVYEKVGSFDEKFLCAFGEDWDYHVRLHKAGIQAYCLDLPFLHHGSMTIKNAELSEIRKIQMQAEKNRQYFKEKWGVVGASPEYYAMFGNTAPEAL